MFLRKLTPVTLLFIAATACYVDVADPEPGPTRPPRPNPNPPEPIGDAFIAWENPATDGIIDMMIETPEHTDRFFRRPVVCDRSQNVGGHHVIASIEHDGRELPFTPDDAHCVRLEEPIAPADIVTITIALSDGRAFSYAWDLPPLPAPESHHTLTSIEGADGMVWSASPLLGLVGVGPTGTVRYAGVLSKDPWDPEAQEPQSAAVLALEPDPFTPGAMWLASAATGISWFDPGADPMSTDDDQWVHGQPENTGSDFADQLAQTAVAIAPDPARPDTAWIATLNGVYHVERVDGVLEVTPIADGSALAISVDPQGRVWAGFTTQAEILTQSSDPNVAPTLEVPPAEGALMVIAFGDDPRVPLERHVAMQDEDAVTALLADADGVWVGTPYGLERATFDGTITLAPSPVDVVDLAVVSLARTDDGFWLAARAECELDHGRLLRVIFDEPDLIAVVDYSELGFGERDFDDVRVLADGRVLVSTLVPQTMATTRRMTAAGCELPAITEHSADTYVITPEDGLVRRFTAP